MVFIVQKYIFKELLRNFVLTAVALTCMMGFGGSLMDMLRSQGITAHEMIKLMIYLMPIVLSYSLPVAALFATTITYGRLSSDNEINACRASGINIYRLLIPAVLLSVLVSSTTFTLENYLIPRLASQVEHLVRRDIQTLAYLELKNRGYISRMNYAMHCGRVESAIKPQLQPDGTYSPGQIELAEVAFLSHERETPVFYGTAKTALILFETYQNDPTVSIHLNQVRAFNEQRGEMIDIAYYPIGPVSIPSPLTMRIKYLSLPKLLEIREDPFRFEKNRKAKDSMYLAFRTAMTYEYIADQLLEEGECELKDSDARCIFTADSVRQQTRDGRLILEGNVSVDYTPRIGPPLNITARNATISAVIYSENLPPAVSIELRDARVVEKKSLVSDRYTVHDRFTLDPILAPDKILEMTSEQAVPVAHLISPRSEYNFNDRLNRERAFVAREKAATVARAIAEIHTRASFSASALVLLLLGAGLGIIFRGGHFVSAFGLSFIPMMVVVVMIITGKQLSSSGAVQMGVIAIWSGIAIVALANLVVLGKFLRR